MKKTGIEKVVLAYSGGLDTSYCVPYLKERYGCEVITVTVFRYMSSEKISSEENIKDLSVVNWEERKKEIEEMSGELDKRKTELSGVKKRLFEGP